MRPDIYEWGLRIAEVVATRATCLRRSVGCVLLDPHGRILATGYNGVATGNLHCNDGQPMGYAVGGVPWTIYPNSCEGAQAKSGTGLDLCQAIHAEANALLQCRDVREIETACVTVSPCVHCVKLLLNTGCRRIVFREEYVHADARDWWLRGGRLWRRIIPPETKDPARRATEAGSDGG